MVYAIVVLFILYLFCYYFFIRYYLLENWIPQSVCSAKRLVEEHRERMRIDGEEEQEIEVTLPPIKRRWTVFPTDSKGMQAQLEKLSEDIQEVKSEIKKFHYLAFRHKFSLSFLLELEEDFLCIICRRIPARKPLIGCSECNSLIGCQKCGNEWYSGIQGLQRKCLKCRCERGVTKTAVLKGFDKLLQQIRNLKDST